MKHTAKWHSITGQVTIVELAGLDADDPGEVIYAGRAESAHEAGELVKQQNFGFTDMWTKEPGEDLFRAPVTPVESQDDTPEFPDR